MLCSLLTVDVTEIVKECVNMYGFCCVLTQVAVEAVKSTTRKVRN